MIQFEKRAMDDRHRSLEEIEKLLTTEPAIGTGEPRRIMLDLARHMIRQQKEHDVLRAELQKLQGEVLTPRNFRDFQKRYL